MPADDVDRYLAALDEPARQTLEQVRSRVLDVVPDAEQCISYGCPAFRVDGRVVAGFAAFPRHLSYLPHSGQVLGQLADELRGYGGTRSALHFARGEPLPAALVERLVRTRQAEVAARGR